MAQAEQVENDKQWIVKADVAEVEIPNALARLAPDETDSFTIDGTLSDSVVKFPLPQGIDDPELFTHIWRVSASLQPAVEAYSTDIDGLGQIFEPTFDPNAENALEELKHAHELYRSWEEIYTDKKDDDDNEEDRLHQVPSDDALINELEDLKAEARRQKMRAEYFFGSACRESSFTRLRKTTRAESEIGGNWFWEIVRHNGRPIRVNKPPYSTMRLLEEDKKPLKVKTKIQVTPIHWVDLEEWRYFRRYVQKYKTGKVTYFRQYDDPRYMCACCGKYVPGDPKNEKDAARKFYAEYQHDYVQSTEIIHDGAVPVPGSSYFLPRWIGALDFVLGERAAAKVNLAYFNSPIPAGMILCSGGKFADGLKEQFEHFMTQLVGTARGHHKIIAVSAVAQNPSLLKDGAAKVSLEWVPLQKERPKDALFLNWINLCEEKVGRQFRLHTLLYGGSERLNKATAWAILKFVEERVYQPLRLEFDDLMNRTLMPEIGVTLWKFRTLSPETRDPATMIKIYDVLQNGPALSTDELRALAGDIVNRIYEAYNKDWSKMPWKLLEYAHDENATLEGSETTSELDDGSGDAMEDHTESPETDEDETE